MYGGTVVGYRRGERRVKGARGVIGKGEEGKRVGECCREGMGKDRGGVAGFRRGEYDGLKV